MSKAYTVFALFEAKEGKENVLRQLLTAVIEPTRKEKACLEYRLHQALENPLRFIFYENWENKAALDRHLQMPYIQALKKETKGLLTKPVEVVVAEEV